MMNKATLDNLKTVIQEYLQGKVKRKDVYDWAKAICKGQVTYREANSNTVYESILNICDKEPNGEYLIRDIDIQQYAELLEDVGKSSSVFSPEGWVLSTIKPIETLNPEIDFKTMRYWLSGIGVMEEGKLISSRENEFYCERMHPENEGFDIYKKADLDWNLAVEDVLETLSCNINEISAFNEKVDKTKLHQYRLMRMDDNGIEYEVDVFNFFYQANDKLKEFESRHHKQTYWIERVEGAKKYRQVIIDEETLKLDSEKSLGNFKVQFDEFCRENGFQYQVFEDSKSGLGDAILLKLVLKNSTEIILGTRPSHLSEGFEIIPNTKLENPLQFAKEFAKDFGITAEQLDLHPRIFDPDDLVQAAFKGDSKLVLELLEKGYDINAEGRCWTPLHAAIENENYECVKILVEHGANIEAIAGNHSALTHAVDISIDGTLQTGGKPGDEPTEIIDLLMRWRANPDEALKLAREYNSIKIIDFIENHYANNQ